MAAAVEKISLRAASMKSAGKTVNNLEIKKAVLRSQPPHANDVPDMVDYNQKWGGGVSEFFVNDVLRYCQHMNVSPTVHVSGKTFKALATLDFGAGNIPSRAVNAILKRMAVSEKVIDGIACVYKPSEIVSIGTNKNNSAMFLEADKIMTNYSKTLKENQIIDPQRTLSEGWLQLSMIDHIMGKPNMDGNVFKSLEDITKSALEKIFYDNGQLSVDRDRDTQSIAAQSSTVLEYNADGVAVDVPKTILLGQGFEVGNKYSKDQVVFRLCSISGDGIAKMQKYSCLGELMDEFIEVPGAELVAHYKTYDKTFKLLEGYPQNEGKYMKDAIQDQWIGRVKECLFTVASSLPDQPLIIRLQPHIGVFAAEDIEAGELTLSPMTTSVSPIDDRKPVSPMVTAMVFIDGALRASFVLGTPRVDKNFCSAFFLVQSVQEKEKANMGCTTQTVRGIGTSIKKLQIAGHEYKVDICCFQNIKNISKGEELLIHKETKPQSRKRESNYLPMNLMKKQHKINLPVG